MHSCPSDSFHCWCRRRLEHLAPCETVCERSLPLCLGVVEPPLFNSGSGAVDPRAIALPCVWTSLVLLRLLRADGLCFGLLASTSCVLGCFAQLGRAGLALDNFDFVVWTTSELQRGRPGHGLPGGVKPLPFEGLKVAWWRTTSTWTWRRRR